MSGAHTGERATVFTNFKEKMVECIDAVGNQALYLTGWTNFCCPNLIGSEDCFEGQGLKEKADKCRVSLVHCSVDIVHERVLPKEGYETSKILGYDAWFAEDIKFEVNI